MLGKLLKYEVKATSRLLLPLFIALVIFAAITRAITALSPNSYSTPAVISMIIYGLIMVAMFVTTFITILYRFHKNLLADEGYLMHTLPVPVWQHILSKLLVSILWIVASGAVAMVSIMILGFEISDFTGIYAFFADTYQRAFAEIGFTLYVLSFEVILGFFLSVAYGILIIYAAMAIGHMFNRHKILASFGAFLVLNTISQLLFVLFVWMPSWLSSIEALQAFYMQLSRELLLQLLIAYYLAFTTLVGAAYFALTNFILSKRLNLE